MKHSDYIPLVSTIGEDCRICYTCVRECPAKAIRIADGQAEVIAERCIGCGNCVRVCSQHAKRVLDSTEPVRILLASQRPVAAIVAPSFPAEFTDCHWGKVIGMIRRLEFTFVNEVAFGADLTARRYRELFEQAGEKRYVATSCPAIVAFVERYHPDLVGNLAPIVSPMVAMARALRAEHGDRLAIVFIGPCIAKKGEAASEILENGCVDAALTFVELREMLKAGGITPEDVEESDFDPPHAAAGAMFPISRGLFHAAEIEEDLFRGEVVAADGRRDFVDAIREFEAGHMDVRLLDVLACNGCIMGPGSSSDAPLFSRRASVRHFVHERMAALDQDRWRENMARFADLDLSRTYAGDDQRTPVLEEDSIIEILTRMGKHTPDDELNCGACGYETCREHAVAILKGLAESEMCLPHTIEQLHSTIGELASSNKRLASTREALMQSEKLASMGQLAAGIAHEVNNPLGVVLMYSHLLLDDCKDDPKLSGDLQLIAQQADRCKKIVAGLLNFARQTKVLRQPTNIHELIDVTLQALVPAENVTVRTRYAASDPTAELDRDQIAQVLTNLIGNAYAAMPDGGLLTILTDGDADIVRIHVADTGCGIPTGNIKKIFEPFFTTKQMGRGTGLGLAVTYGIIKMHNGQITVESNADPDAAPTGSTFTVALPRMAPTE